MVGYMLEYLVASEWGYLRKDERNVNDMIWKIKALIWRWSFIDEITHFSYNFYDFCKYLVFFLS